MIQEELDVVMSASVLSMCANELTETINDPDHAFDRYLIMLECFNDILKKLEEHYAEHGYGTD